MIGLLMTPANAVKCCNGTKWETRRVMIPQPTNRPPFTFSRDEWSFQYRGRPGNYAITTRLDGPEGWEKQSPYGLIGARLPLLTTWAVSKSCDSYRPSQIIPSGQMFWHAGIGGEKPDWAGKSRPGRFLTNEFRLLMPMFELTRIRVQHVRDITEEDAIAEGFPLPEGDHVPFYGPQGDFLDAWDAINGKRAGGAFKCKRNPWVWVLTFKRVEAT
jgi:hypothetical protein